MVAVQDDSDVGLFVVRNPHPTRVRAEFRLDPNWRQLLLTTLILITLEVPHMFAVEYAYEEFYTAGGLLLTFKFTVAIVMGFALVAWSQERVVRVPRKLSLPVPQMDKGIVEGKTYKNPSVGLELTPSPGLEFEPPELMGTPGTVPLLVTIAAYGEKKWFSTRNATAFYADALAYFPDDQRSTEAYMRKVVRFNGEQGFKPVAQSPDGKLGGVSFSRTDFTNGLDYSVVMVRACETLALVFIFTGSGRDEVNKLIAATQVKLDLARSGCGPSASGARK